MEGEEDMQWPRRILPWPTALIQQAFCMYTVGVSYLPKVVSYSHSRVASHHINMLRPQSASLHS